MKFISVLNIFALLGATFACEPTITTVTGPLAPSQVCAGDLIFEENFNSLDTSKWLFANTLGGGGNWEFQWYPGQDALNAWTRDGHVHFVPTFTSELFGESFLTSGRVIIPPNECTWADFFGCDRQGTPDNIINPIRSTRIDTSRSFGFKFGELEIRARAPAADWSWPALWLLPVDSVYGTWPRSGEIDLMELRGNRNLRDPHNGNIHVGVEQAASTMHFGPNWDVNGWPTAHYTQNRSPGFNVGFHTYSLRWTDTYIQFFIDGVSTGRVEAGSGFWDRGGFHNSGFTNPWANATPMAPFDQPFYIILNLAVGGTNYFADHFVNLPLPKPWLNTSPRAAADFWENRAQWEPTWLRGTEESHFVIDYVRVRAL